MKIDELIRDLKYTVLHLPWSQIRKGADEVVDRVVATLEAQQGRIAELEAELKEERRWIPVGERLPEDNSNVLAYLRIGEAGRIYPANYAKGVWWDRLFSTPATNTTTHWMPLPEPPEVDG